MKIFDCLAHPTLDQTWLGQPGANSFDNLIVEMRSAGIPWACAVGLEGVGGFEPEVFAKECAQFPNLFPVAGFNPLSKSGATIQAELRRLRGLGYVGIKIHPRFSQINLQRDIAHLVDVAHAAHRTDLTVFFCTYYACTAPGFPAFDPLTMLAKLLSEAPQTRFVLVHGGTVRLLEYIELARFNPNVLIDLSLSLMKYEGSSLDLDLRFAFQKFDQRICVGSDHPEWPLVDFRRKVQKLCEGLDEARIRRITHENLQSFLSVDLPPA